MRSCVPLIAAALLCGSGCGTTGEVATHWQSMGGPTAQNVSAILSTQAGEGSLLAGLTTGEIFQSQNGGASWSQIGTLTSPVPITRFLRDPDSTSLIMAATEAGLFVTRDGGRTWDLSGPRSRHGEFLPCRSVALDPWTPAVCYAGTSANGIFKSTNRGADWEAANGRSDSIFLAREVYDIAVSPSRPDFLFAAVSGLGVVRSTDGGGTWEQKTPLVTALSPATTHILVHPRDERMVLYASEIGTIARSTDRGETWKITNQEEEAWRILSLVADPSDPEIVYAGAENGVWVSTNFGASWSDPLSTLPNIPTNIRAVSTRAGTTLYAFGAGIGVKVSQDGGTTWGRADNNLGGATITLLNTDPAGSEVYAAVGIALLRYDQATDSWVAAGSGLSGGRVTSIAFDADTTTTLFATTTGGVFRSADRGEHWKPIARNVRMSARFIDTHPAIRTRMFASGPTGIFVSTDKGSSWSQAYPQGRLFRFSALTFTPTNAGIIHAATPSEGILLTTDGGIHWEQSRYGISSDSIGAITMNSASPSEYFAWTGSGECFVSTDRGLEWKRFVPPWRLGDSVQIAYDRLRPFSVVALVNGKELLYSGTGGRTWVQSPVGVALPGVKVLHWNARTSTLYAGTSDRGVFRISLTLLVEASQE